MYIFKAGVVGGGFMGAEIAQVISFSGLPVVVKDVDSGMLKKAEEHIRAIAGFAVFLDGKAFPQPRLSIKEYMRGRWRPPVFLETTVWSLAPMAACGAPVWRRAPRAIGPGLV